MLGGLKEDREVKEMLMTEPRTVKQQQEILLTIQEALSGYSTVRHELEQQLTREQEELEGRFEESGQRAKTLFTEVSRIEQATHYVFQLGNYELDERPASSQEYPSDLSSLDTKQLLLKAQGDMANLRNLYGKMQSEMAASESLGISFIGRGADEVVEVHGRVKKRAGWGTVCVWGALGLLIGYVALYVVLALILFPLFSSGGDEETANALAMILGTVVGVAFGIYMTENTNNSRLSFHYAILDAARKSKMPIKTYLQAWRVEYDTASEEFADYRSEQFGSCEFDLVTTLTDVKASLGGVVDHINQVCPPWDDASWQQRYP